MEIPAAISHSTFELNFGSTGILLTALFSFFLGSIPTGYIISRKFYGLDIRTLGSGNIGATNVRRTLGRKPGVITLLLDLAKGMLSVSLSWLVAPASALTECGLFFGTCAIFGHCFSPFLKLKGGKGVATALGVFLIVNPIVAALAVIIFRAVLSLTRYVSLASLSAAASVPPLMWICSYVGLPKLTMPTSYSTLDFLLALTSVLVIFLRHHENISRLLARTEPPADSVG